MGHVSISFGITEKSRDFPGVGGMSWTVFKRRDRNKFAMCTNGDSQKLLKRKLLQSLG